MHWLFFLALLGATILDCEWSRMAAPETARKTRPLETPEFAAVPKVPAAHRLGTTALICR